MTSSRDLQVTIAAGGPFPAPLRLAAYLSVEGHLGRMMTFMPLFRIGWANVPRSKIVSFWPLAYFSYAARHVPAPTNKGGYVWQIDEWFDRLASHRLGECTLFDGWCMTALHSLRQAKREGAVTVLHMGSAHVDFSHEVLTAEYAKYGARGTPIDARLVQKARSEYEEADHLVVPSSFVKRTLMARGVREDKISVVPEALTRKLPLSANEDHTFRVVYVGRLELRKGVQYLLEAFSTLHLRGAELVLVGGVTEELRPLLQQYSGLYTLTGQTSDEELGMILGGASVVVVPSVEDGWCHVTLEALSCGVPVIVSKNVGSADLIRDGVNGFVVPACDSVALAERIERLFRDPNLRDYLGANTSIDVRTWRDYGEEMVQLFRDWQSDYKPQ